MIFISKSYAGTYANFIVILICINESILRITTDGDEIRRKLKFWTRETYYRIHTYNLFFR